MPSAPYSAGLTSLREELNRVPLSLHGNLPTWLTGTLIRTGPAQFELPEQAYRHWFDGLAMLYRFDFQADQVVYTNRCLHSQTFQHNQAKRQLTRGEFATNPPRSLWQRFTSLFSGPPSTDNGNVNITVLANQPVAVTETTVPVAFDPETLHTLGHFAYQDHLAGQTTVAHPHFDFSRQTLFSYQTAFGRDCTYNFYSMNMDSASRQLISAVPVQEPAYMHSFGMSENYLILSEFPLVVNPLRLATTALHNTPYIENFRWQPERGTRFRIIRKDNGEEVSTCITEPFFAFHHINAFERDGEVVVDLSTYPDAKIIQNFYLDHLREGIDPNIHGRCQRYFLPLTGGEATSETLSSAQMEFPRINYRHYNSQPYRYAYGGDSRSAGDFINQLAKVDVQERKTSIWHEDHCYPGEPVFVANPDGVAEDDGVLLSVVLNRDRNQSFLLILDAQSMQEIARAEVPHTIPFNLHGQYFAAPDTGDAAKDASVSVATIHR